MTDDIFLFDESGTILKGVKNKSIKSATIPERVIIIDNFAFSGCTSLTSLTIGNNVKEFGKTAFYDCSGLTSVKIPNCVKKIGDGAFSNCI